MPTFSDVDSDSFEYPSSDDESPEDVSFKTSKSNALASMMSVKETLNREKQEKKERRKAIEQRNIKQKKRKALSVDFLDQIDKVMEENNAVKQLLQKKQDEKKKAKNPKEIKNVYTGNDEDMKVPLSKVKRYSRQPDISAAEFKNKILYRNQTKRIDASTRQSIKAKRSERFRR